MRDAVWTYGRLGLGSALMSHGGDDHSGSSWSVLTALGLGDVDLVEQYLPADTPPSRSGLAVMRAIVDTTVALRHGEHVEVAVERSLRASEPKSGPAFERLLGRYLHGVLVEDRASAEVALVEIAQTWSTTPWLRIWKDPVIKDLSLMLHGLVALGEMRFPGIEAVARRARAYSPALARLVGDLDSLPQPPSPVVTFTGSCEVANAVLTPRPLDAVAVTP